MQVAAGSMEVAEASGADPREGSAAAAGALAEGRLVAVRIGARRATREGALSVAHIAEVLTKATVAEFWAAGIAADTRAIEARQSEALGILRVASTDFRAPEVPWRMASGAPSQNPVEIPDFPGLGVLSTAHPQASAMSALR